MPINLASFGGLVPRYSEHSLGLTQATIAHNVKLRNGRIEAWREPSIFKAGLPQDARSFTVDGCCVRVDNHNTYFANVSAEWGRTYVTGHIDGLEFFETNEDCDLPTNYYLAGLPAPTTPPVATAVEECTRATGARSYVYTYINMFGEESAPSPPSNIVSVEDIIGTTVTVSNLTFPANRDRYGIIGMRLYRTATGFRPVDGKLQEPMTEYLYVDTTQNNTYQDNILDLGLAHVLDTYEVMPPPNGLAYVTAVPDRIQLVGAVYNRLYLSEVFQPYNFPIKNMLILDRPVTGIKTIQGNLLILTTGKPYLLSMGKQSVLGANNPDEFGLTEVDLPYPNIGGLYVASTISTNIGVFYVSNVGVVLINPNLTANVVTSAWFSIDDWEKLLPHTARLAYWQGYLFCITDNISFILEIGRELHNDIQLGELSTISDKPVDMVVSDTGILYMLENGVVKCWNLGNTFRPYQWESRDLSIMHQPSGRQPDANPVTGTHWYPSIARVKSNHTSFSIKGIDYNTEYEREIFDPKPIRLPRMGRQTNYRVKFSGIEPVEYCILGTSMTTISQGA